MYSEPLRKGIFIGVLLAVAGGICAVLGSGDRFDQVKGGELFVKDQKLPLGRKKKIGR